MYQKKKEEKMKLTFEGWIEKLKKKNPNLNWDLMTEATINELRDTYEGSKNEKNEK